MDVPRPVRPDTLGAALADRIAGLPTPAVVAVDGAPATEPAELSEAIVEALRSRGLPAGHVRGPSFWRDASVRFEHGRQDVDAYRDWLDAPALRREVIDALRSRGEYLPSLRDPATNRATREPPVTLGPAGIVVVSGPFLLRHGLDFDLIVHLAASPQALARRTADSERWTTPAFARYEQEIETMLAASVVVRCDDPRHPAVLGL